MCADFWVGSFVGIILPENRFFVKEYADTRNTRIFESVTVRSPAMRRTLSIGERKRSPPGGGCPRGNEGERVTVNLNLCRRYEAVSSALITKYSDTNF